MNWVTKTLKFKATDTSAWLTFSSNTTSAWGPALDNVRISAVPLPAGGLLLIGALGGLAALRRRKTA